MLVDTKVPDMIGRREESGADYPRDRTIHALFEEQAARDPAAVALLLDGGEWTYAQLNTWANRLAHRLLRMGISRGALVGLCAGRSPELIAAMLGILKAGGAYVPLDPQYPGDRLELMIRDTAAPAILASRGTRGRLGPVAARAEIVCIDSDEASLARENPTNPSVEGSGLDLAYVMYTSGSTGTPKGVMVGHRAVVRLVRNTNYCHFGRDEVFLQLAPISFDASTFEIWGALLNGARLAIMPPDPPTLGGLGTAIRRHGVTTLWLTAGLFHLMVEQRVEALRPLRQLVAGGDVLSPSHVRMALDELRDGVVINGYGPTETTTFACCHRMAKGDRIESSIPIGRPISHTTVYLLDEGLQAVSAGEPGELCIGGDGVGRGYLNHPELTRQRFVADPFSTEPGARMYRTGDRARLRPDGTIEFLGRLDDQVKILGHRVEPGEVEAVLGQHPGVRQAAVIARPDSRGERRLLAYFVGAAPGCPDPAELKDYLAGLLPHFMIPAAFTRLESLPLSPNGKVDRSRLPDLEARPPSGPALAPATAADDLEGVILEIWERTLDRRVGPEDNFFDLGGDSLHLVEVHSELQKALGGELSIMDLFEFTTVRSLARHLGRAGLREPDPAVADPALTRAGDRARRQKEALSRRCQSGAVS
jgi:amino acid adenylation domain-containing protein